MAVQILPASRSELDGFLKGSVLSTKFHELFEITEDASNSK